MKKPKIEYQKYVVVEFHNGGTFVYCVKSDKPITLASIIKYFSETESWNEWQDNITVLDDLTTIIF